MLVLLGALLCFAVLCCAMLYHAMLCHAMPLSMSKSMSVPIPVDQINSREDDSTSSAMQCNPALAQTEPKSSLPSCDGRECASKGLW